MERVRQRGGDKREGGRERARGGGARGCDGEERERATSTHAVSSPPGDKTIHVGVRACCSGQPGPRERRKEGRGGGAAQAQAREGGVTGAGVTRAARTGRTPPRQLPSPSPLALNDRPEEGPPPSPLADGHGLLRPPLSPLPPRVASSGRSGVTSPLAGGPSPARPRGDRAPAPPAAPAAPRPPRPVRPGRTGPMRPNRSRPKRCKGSKAGRSITAISACLSPRHGRRGWPRGGRAPTLHICI